MIAIVASVRELPPAARVWGTGGWLPPDERQALDWLILSRASGWRTDIVHADDAASRLSAGKGYKAVILACDATEIAPDALTIVERLAAVDGALVVAVAPPRLSPLAEFCGAHRATGGGAGRCLRWTGPGSRNVWTGGDIEIHPLVASENAHLDVWATVDDEPVVTVRRIGAGAVATLGFQPSQAADACPGASMLLKQLLVWGCAAPLAWLDWSGTVVLRMDDPGGAQNVYCQSWCYPKLEEQAWRAVGVELARRGARLSIGYVPGWVDDGDEARGELLVHGSKPPREAGAVRPSPLVTYRDIAGHRPGSVCDYAAEYRGIQRLRAASLAEVEVHGFTHLHPDTGKWLRASDRYTNVAWFRDLGGQAAETIDALPDGDHPLDQALQGFSKYFSTRPTTLIPPGDEWTQGTMLLALKRNLALVSSYYLAIRHQDRFCWATHICAPYLDEAHSRWLQSCLPVVGYFHDQELVTEGIPWMARCLDEWTAAGAQRFVDFRELAAALGRHVRLRDDAGQLTLDVEEGGAPPLVRPLVVQMRLAAGSAPPVVRAHIGGLDCSLPVTAGSDGFLKVALPASEAETFD